MGLAGNNQVLRVKDNKVIPIQQMVRNLKNANFVFVGESHDSIEDHQSELNIIRSFAKIGKPIAIGLEMFRAEAQKHLDAWVQGTSTPEQFIPIYYENWKMPWPLYGKIFEFAREQKIPLIGLNIPDEIVEEVSRSGFAALDERTKRQLPPDITCAVDTEYMNFIRKAFGGHHPSEKSSFLHFCEAQMVWDTSMAHHLVDYAKKNPGRTVVVITGMIHAWKRAMPEQVSKLVKNPFKVVLPETGGTIDKPGITTEDADYVLLRNSERKR